MRKPFSTTAVMSTRVVALARTDQQLITSVIIAALGANTVLAFLRDPGYRRPILAARDRGPERYVRNGLSAGAKEIRTVGPTVEACVPRGYDIAFRAAPAPESRPPERGLRHGVESGEGGYANTGGAYRNPDDNF
jgi:hypothetical protein